LPPPRTGPEWAPERLEHQKGQKNGAWGVIARLDLTRLAPLNEGGPKERLAVQQTPRATVPRRRLIRRTPIVVVSGLP
jgi:hypothetical protein